MEDGLHADIVAYKKVKKIPTYVQHKSNFQKVAEKYKLNGNYLTRDGKRIATVSMLEKIWKTFHLKRNIFIV